jgi:hypothetical protein
MAKIRVGDIEIDGSQITIGGRQVTTQSSGHMLTTGTGAPVAPTPPNALATTPPAPNPRNDLAKFPGSPALWVLAGAGLFAYASLFATVPYFLYLGLGLSVLGIMKNRALREEKRHLQRLEQQKQLLLETALAPTLEKIRRALDEVSTTRTVEQLAQQTRIPQPELLRGLVCLRDQAEVTEDLDVESGEWVYSLVRRPLPAQNLDARLAALEEEEAAVPSRR